MPAFGEIGRDRRDRLEQLLGRRHIAALQRLARAAHQQIDAGAARLQKDRQDLLLKRLGLFGRTGLGERREKRIELLPGVRLVRRRHRRAAWRPGPARTGGNQDGTGARAHTHGAKPNAAAATCQRRQSRGDRAALRPVDQFGEMDERRRIRARQDDRCSRYCRRRRHRRRTRAALAELAGAQLPGDLGLQQRIGASRAATQMAFGNFEHRMAGGGQRRRTRLAAGAGHAAANRAVCKAMRKRRGGVATVAGRPVRTDPSPWPRRRRRAPTIPASPARRWA